MKRLCIMQAPVSSRSGYGDHARDIAIALINSYESEWDIQFIDTRWGSCPRNGLKSDIESHHSIVNRMVLDPNSLTQQPDIFIHLTVPNEFQPIGKFNIGITAGIETTLCSREWVEGMNRMNMVIVPSEHAKSVFVNTIWNENAPNGQLQRQIKTTVPIEVLFEGIDTNIFDGKKPEKYSSTIKDVFRHIPETFCYLFVGHWIKGDIGHDRKDIGMLVKSFYETFKNMDKTPALILKTSGATMSAMDRYEIMQKLDAVKASMMANKLPNVYLVHGELTPSEINELYNHGKVKVHVSFTKGEGFGRPLLEASTSGKPIMAPLWSGQVDFLPKDLIIPLPGTLNRIHASAVWKNVLIPESQWHTVNYGFAGHAMKELFSNYSKYTPNAKKLAKLNSSKFTLVNMTKKFKEIVDSYVANVPVQKQFVLPKLQKVDDSHQPGIKLPKLQKIT